jgi:DNA processing protein
VNTASESVHTWLRLSLVPGLGATALQRLIAEFGSPEAIVAASRERLARVVDTSVADAIFREPERALLDAALGWANAPQRALLAPNDPRYPPLLLETPDPPPILYAAGQIELLTRTAIAVVGSRNASAQGMRNAEEFAHGFSLAQCCVVSGLALGIDTAAHRGGLSGPGKSIAVLGNGIDVVYPKRNAALR